MKTRPTARSSDRSGRLSARRFGAGAFARSFAQQRVAAAGAHGQMRVRGVGRDGLVDQAAARARRRARRSASTASTPMSSSSGPATNAACGIVGHNRSSYGSVAPRAALAEHGRVVVPRAQPALVPDEVIAHARAPADRALDERFGRVRETVEDVLGQVVGVDDRRLGERIGHAADQPMRASRSSSRSDDTNDRSSDGSKV